jgi:hypothetical protein
MELLKEIIGARQNDGERKRRWFNSTQMDLFVWIGRAQRPVKFQLCYDKGNDEKALTWSKHGRYQHESVDAGETEGIRYKQSAILAAAGSVDAKSLAAIFTGASANLPNQIRDFVLDKIKRHPSYEKDV